MRSKTVVVVAIIAVVGAVAGFLIVLQQPTTSQTDSGVKQFTIFLVESGPNRAWEPKTITVKLGEKVKLTIVNSDTENPAMPTFHRFVLEEFNIGTKDIAPNQQVTVEFVADKAGRFRFFDPRPDEMVGRENVRHSQEVGEFIVEG